MNNGHSGFWTIVAAVVLALFALRSCGNSELEPPGNVPIRVGTCIRCGGDGQMSCPYHGCRNGWVKTIYGPGHTCGVCNGRGRVRCTMCFGSGRS